MTETLRWQLYLGHCPNFGQGSRTTGRPPLATKSPGPSHPRPSAITASRASPVIPELRFAGAGGLRPMETRAPPSTRALDALRVVALPLPAFRLDDHLPGLPFEVRPHPFRHRAGAARPLSCPSCPCPPAGGASSSAGTRGRSDAHCRQRAHGHADGPDSPGQSSAPNPRRRTCPTPRTPASSTFTALRNCPFFGRACLQQGNSSWKETSYPFRRGYWKLLRQHSFHDGNLLRSQTIARIVHLL